MDKDIKFDIQEINNYEDGNNYKISIKIPMSIGWIESVSFIAENTKNSSNFKIDHVKNDNDYAYFEGEVFLKTQAIYHYYFLIDLNGQILYLKNDNSLGNSISPSEKCKLSVNFDVPDWAKGKMMYHIFIDRFNKGSSEKLKPMPRRSIHNSWDEEIVIGPNDDNIWNADFYGGDLKGIIEKLDYLKSLGISILYLSPVCYSQSNHRYDTSDYEMVDPYAGTLEDLEELCLKAHNLGMRVILDFVFNHTGNDSKYFNEYNAFDTLGAFQSKDSPYYDFYRKVYYDGNEHFDYWWGFKNEVVCDGNSKKWQDYIYGENGIVAKYFNLGIDGIRYDVADELSDSFIEECNSRAKTINPDAYFVGEVWKNPMRMNRGYIESGKALHSVMNYSLMDALIRYYKYEDVDKLREILRQIKVEYPREAMLSLMNFTSTHDITRAINLFATDEFQVYGEWAWNLLNEDRYWQNDYKLTKEQYEKGKQILKSYVFALTFLPGNLSIFYGDEVGLEGMGNLSNRKPFPWDNIDEDLLEFYRKVGKIRNIETFLEQADLNIYDITKDYFMFERVNDNGEALVVVNRTPSNLNVLIPEKYLNYDRFYEVNNSDLSELKPYGGISRIRK